MLRAIATLLVFQCLGEGVSYLFKLPVPGPVIGMLLLCTLEAADAAATAAMSSGPEDEADQ